MNFKNVLATLTIASVVVGCSNSKFELPNSIAESEGFIFYFDSDSTYKTVEKSKIGGIAGSILLTDTSVYFNPNSEDELVFNYRKKNDSLEFFNSDTTMNFLIKTTSEDELFAFDRQFNENKRLGIPPAVFSPNDFEGLESDDAKNIISKIWKNSLVYYKYPETVRASSFNAEKRTPSNEFERKWNAEELYDDYSFFLGVYAQNALKQEDYSSMYGYVIMNNGKMEKLIFPKYDEVDEQYEWRSYSTPDNFSEDDINQVNSILKANFKIDVGTNVEDLQIYEPTSDRETYSLYLNTIKEVWQPYGYISGGYMTKIHSFKLTKTNGEITIKRS
tara:strand:- start:1108 stop:2103 length:996 start_codon:yes stop_codon:yes gene_type:complete